MIINDAKKPIILYGMGNLGKKVLKELLQKGVSVKACLDKNTKEPHINGIPVYRPEDFNPNSQQNVMTVICIVTVPFLDIYNELTAMGYQNICHISNLMKDARCVFEAYWKLSSKEAACLESQRTPEIFCDDNSKKAYQEASLWLLTGKEHIISKHESFEDKYWLSGVRKMLGPTEAIVDCGAYNGDSISPLLDEYPQNNFTFYAFEPGDGNVLMLKDRFRNREDTVKCYPYGLGSSEASSCFLEDGASSRYLSINHPKSIDTVRREIKPLDLVMAENAYTVLKVAAEGMGYDVLQGAVSTIKKYRPLIITNLHHSKTDFINIPACIKQNCEDYHIYLKLHGYCGQEIVLYAVPLERDGYQLAN